MLLQQHTSVKVCEFVCQGNTRTPFNIVPACLPTCLPSVPLWSCLMTYSHLSLFITVLSSFPPVCPCSRVLSNFSFLFCITIIICIISRMHGRTMWRFTARLKAQCVWFSAIVPLRMQNATAASFSPLYYVPFLISCAVRVSSHNSKFWKISFKWGWSSRSFHLLALRLHPLQLLWYHCPSFWDGPRICLEVCPTFSFTVVLAILPQTLSFRAYGRNFFRLESPTPPNPLGCFCFSGKVSGFG